MMLSRRFLIAGIAILVLWPLVASAQKEHSVWEFGYGAGLEFRDGNVLVRNTNRMRQLEGCASIADRRSGELLFYTDGITVWGRNNKPMPNGRGLLGHYSSTQSALIVPVPCHPQRYYVVTSDQQGYDGPSKGQHWSVVDMRLNNGAGDVIAASRNTLLRGDGGEQITAVAHANGRDYWVVSHGIGGHTFHAYRATSFGIDPTPTISVAGTSCGKRCVSPANELGMLKASPDGHHLALTNHELGTVDLFDFDPATGRVTNPLRIYTAALVRGDDIYGVSFSPSGEYLLHGARGDLYRYSLRSTDSDAIIASRLLIPCRDGRGRLGVRGALQIAPDGNVYVVADSGWLGRVENVEAEPSAIVFTERWQRLSTRLFLGLPNDIDAVAPIDRIPTFPIDASGPLTLCDAGSVTLTAADGMSDYRWSNGSLTRSITVRDPGLYKVAATDADGCTVSAALRVSREATPNPIIEGPSVVCSDGSIELRIPGEWATCRWSTGDTSCAIVVSTAGVYSAVVTSHAGCSAVARKTVAVVSAPRPSISGRRSICSMEQSILDAGAGYSSYRWSSGDTTRTIVVGASGSWWVQVADSNGCLGTSDVASVTMHNAPVPVITPMGSTRFCDGNSVVLEAGSGFTSYLWSSGEVTRRIVVRHSGGYSVRVSDSSGCVGISAIIDVEVDSIPIVATAGGRYQACSGERVLLSVAGEYAGYLWSTGEKTRQIEVDRTGIYTAYVTNASGCTSIARIDTVVIHAPLARPIITRHQNTLVSSNAIRWQWRRNGLNLPHEVSQKLSLLERGLYSVVIVDHNGCVAESAPMFIESTVRAWLDTAHAQVGHSFTMALRISAAAFARSMPVGYRVQIRLAPRSFRVLGVRSSDDTASGAPHARFTKDRNGLVTIERSPSDPVKPGDTLLLIELEGLAEAQPINEIRVEQVILMHTVDPLRRSVMDAFDTVMIGGGGIVILGGCDIAHGFVAGRRAVIRSLAPNPVIGADALLQYRLPSGTEGASVQIFDALGRQVAKRMLPLGTGRDETLDLDMGNLQSGRYVLRLTQGAEQASMQVVVYR